MALCIHGQPVSGSAESAPLAPSRVFEALSSEFEFDRSIGEWMVHEWGLQTLSDLQHAFSAQWGICSLINEV